MATQNTTGGGQRTGYRAIMREQTPVLIGPDNEEIDLTDASRVAWLADQLNEVDALVETVQTAGAVGEEYLRARKLGQVQDDLVKRIVALMDGTPAASASPNGNGKHSGSSQEGN